MIKEDATAYDIAKTLKSKGLIEDSLVFVVQEKLSNYSGKMRPGTYLLSTAYTPNQNYGYSCGRCGAGGSNFVIVEERMRTYINSLDTGNTPFLDELERYALLRMKFRSSVRRCRAFIKTLAGTCKSRSRFWRWGRPWASPHFLCVSMDRPDMHITTIENYEKRIPTRRENFQQGRKRRHRITFLKGDAGEILKKLSGRFL